MRSILRLPPVWLIGMIAAASVLHSRLPLSFGVPFDLGLVAGGFLGLSAVTIAVLAFAEMRRSGTTIEPGRRPTALVTRGPFSFTRNPLYVAQILLVLALAVAMDSLWFVAAALVLWIALDRLVVVVEERTIEEAFGEEYRAYKRKVRRWAGASLQLKR